MDCIICNKVFEEEIEYKDDPLPDPEACTTSIIKLLNIPAEKVSEVQKILQDGFVICLTCHEKLENAGVAMKMLARVGQWQKLVDTTKTKFRQGMMESKEVSELMGKILNRRMSRASLGRLAILEAIGAECDEEEEMDIETERADGNLGHNEVGEEILIDQQNEFQPDQIDHEEVIQNEADNGHVEADIPEIGGGQVQQEPLQVNHAEADNGNGPIITFPQDDEDEVDSEASKRLSSKVTLGHVTIHGGRRNKCPHCSRKFIIETGRKETATLNTPKNANDHVHHPETLQEEQAEQFQGSRTSEIDQMDNDAVQGPSRPPPGPIIQKKLVVPLKRSQRQNPIIQKKLVPLKRQIPPKANSTFICKTKKSKYCLRKRKPVKLEEESISEQDESEVETTGKEAKSQERFQGRVCSKKFSNKEDLNRHETIHTDSERRIYKCQHCSRGFLSKIRLRTHLGNETPTKCKACKETFKGQGCLNKHDWKVHGKGVYAIVRGSVLKYYSKLADGKFKCKRCPTIIAARTTLKAYKLSHEPPSYLCKAVGKNLNANTA